MINSYNFSVNLAIKYGLDEAVMLTNFIFWIDKNKANQNHYHDGYYWTYNSVKAFAEQYPFWTEKQIRRILNSLEKQGAILTGNYNKIAYDRTKWYTVAEEAISIYLNSNTDLPKWENGSEEKVEPIPDIKPDIKTNIYNNIFEFYLSLGLIKHKCLNDTMKNAMKKAIKENKYTEEDMKELLKIHKNAVEATKGTNYAIKARPLHEFFGQKILGGTALICTQYEEGGKYYKYKNNQPKQPKKQEKTIKLEDMF